MTENIRIYKRKSRNEFDMWVKVNGKKFEISCFLDLHPNVLLCKFHSRVSVLDVANCVRLIFDSDEIPCEKIRFTFFGISITVYNSCLDILTEIARQVKD